MVSAATRTSVGTGLWSAAGTWDTAVPEAGDTAVIAAGHTVTYDIESGSEVDLAGLTINGILVAEQADANDYVLKCSADIAFGANGKLNAGTASVPFPVTSTFTIDFDGTASSLECSTNTGNINLYCAQPTNKYILLSGEEAAGQTELSVATDVTGDPLWAAGAIVRIDDIGNQDSEERVIAAGGVGASTITVTAGLTNAKVTGAWVVLCRRNIRIIGSTDYAVKDGVSCVIGAEIDCTAGVNGGSGHTISGTVSGCTTGVNGGSGHTISGTVSGCGSGVYSGSGHTISGTVSGCNYGVYVGSGHTISGVLNNTANIYRVPETTCYGAVFTGTENADYNTDYCPAWSYVVSYDHDGVSGAYKSWSRGGITLSETSTVPVGYTQGYKLTCESASVAGFHQKKVALMPGETLSVTGYIRFADDHSSYKPRLQIVDCGADPLWGTAEVALDEAQVSSGTATGWQAVGVDYTNSTAIPKDVYVRTLAKRASGDVYFAWQVDRDYPAVSDVRYGTTFAHGSTGTVVLPTVDKVLLGSRYGAGGTEYTGALETTTDGSSSTDGEWIRTGLEGWRKR
jgi:hypothetical protein